MQLADQHIDFMTATHLLFCKFQLANNGALAEGDSSACLKKASDYYTKFLKERENKEQVKNIDRLSIEKRI